MLPGILQEVMIRAGWLQNYFNTIHTPDTFQNRYAIRYNLKIFASIFSDHNWRKNKNIELQPEKLKECIVRTRYQKHQL